MKTDVNDHINRATLVKISPGHYRVIAATPEELIVAKQWAAFWGHQIAVPSRCRPRRIPPLFTFRRAIHLLCLKSRVKL